MILYTGWYKDACELREEETLENFNGKDFENSVSAVFLGTYDEIVS
jgi:hypothetical protein